MNRLKQLRLEKGLTIQEVADATGISVEDMIIYENMSLGIDIQSEAQPPVHFGETFG